MIVPQCTWCTWAWAPWWFLSPLSVTSQVLERTPWMMSFLCAVASKLQLWCDHKWGLCFQGWTWALPLWHAHAMMKKRQTWDMNPKWLLMRECKPGYACMMSSGTFHNCGRMSCDLELLHSHEAWSTHFWLLFLIQISRKAQPFWHYKLC